MATTTPNFGWDIPQSTDLVKDGATAIAALGNDIDTSMVDLKGGTTGQILSKASNTDMDFTWTSPNPGDITGVTAGTGLTGGGTSGAVTLDFDVANYGGGQWAAGKNKIINGNFGIWQRGTSFSNPASSVYTADRWQVSHNGTGATRTISQQSFTAGTAPVSGYEGTFFLRYALSAVGTGNTYQLIQQPIEDVRTFAGQTVTLSFWAKAGANATISTDFDQYFGSGGSADVYSSQANHSVTTSWTRFTQTITLGSISGKTIGTGSFLAVRILPAAATTITLDIWGVQVEAGSTATPFQTASGTIQGESALCQRYLPVALTTVYDPVYGFAQSTTATYVNVQFKVPARVAPTGISVSSASHFQVLNKGLTAGTPTGITFDTAGVNSASIYATTTAGSPTIAAGEGGLLRSVNASGLILFTGCEL